jgi:hypothetical protein
MHRILTIPWFVWLIIIVVGIVPAIVGRLRRGRQPSFTNLDLSATNAPAPIMLAKTSRLSWLGVGIAVASFLAMLLCPLLRHLFFP